MSELRKALDMAKLAWFTMSPWKRLRTALYAAQGLLYIVVGVIIADGMIQQAGEMYITPLGWALWFLIVWFTIGGIFMVAKTPAAILAAIIGIRGRPAIAKTILNDLEWLGKRAIVSSAFILGGLGLPVVFGVINLFIIAAESGGLSQAQVNGLVAPTAVLVVIVAFVQIFHILVALTPVNLWIKRDIERLQAHGIFPEPEDFEGEAINPATMAGIFTVLAVVIVGVFVHV